VVKVPINDSKHWRKRVEEARVLAHKITDKKAKEPPVRCPPMKDRLTEISFRWNATLTPRRSRRARSRPRAVPPARPPATPRSRPRPAALPERRYGAKRFLSGAHADHHRHRLYRRPRPAPLRQSPYSARFHKERASTRSRCRPHLRQLLPDILIRCRAVCFVSQDLVPPRLALRAGSSPTWRAPPEHCYATGPRGDSRPIQSLG
jgi:hypothetical protein